MVIQVQESQSNEGTGSQKIPSSSSSDTEETMENSPTRTPGITGLATGFLGDVYRTSNLAHESSGVKMWNNPKFLQVYKRARESPKRQKTGRAKCSFMVDDILKETRQSKFVENRQTTSKESSTNPSFMIDNILSGTIQPKLIERSPFMVDDILKGGLSGSEQGTFKGSSTNKSFMIDNILKEAFQPNLTENRQATSKQSSTKKSFMIDDILRDVLQPKSTKRKRNDSKDSSKGNI
ncbi:hypothetical protein Aperf_G00000027128 [Anoplocephala perfoliata]